MEVLLFAYGYITTVQHRHPYRHSQSHAHIVLYNAEYPKRTSDLELQLPPNGNRMNDVGKVGWLRCPEPPGLPGHPSQWVMCNQTPPGPRGKIIRQLGFTIECGK
jgi:hypothetical protein